MKYICPFCYKTMPQSYEPSGWSCCGEVGHATILPECPKCGAESLGLPLTPCAICGWEVPAGTPRTDLAQFVGLPEMGRGPRYVVEADFARQLERELNAALIAAGVASLERGEWADERRALLAANETLQSALRVIVESLTREDPPHQISIGYALGTARRALCEVSND